MSLTGTMWDQDSGNDEVMGTWDVSYDYGTDDRRAHPHAVQVRRGRSST